MVICYITGKVDEKRANKDPRELEPSFYSLLTSQPFNVVISTGLVSVGVLLLGIYLCVLLLLCLGAVHVWGG